MCERDSVENNFPHIHEQTSLLTINLALKLADRLRSCTSLNPSFPETIIHASCYQIVIPAVAYGRGFSRGEVGMAVINMTSCELHLCQMSDTNNYVKTMAKMNLFRPTEVRNESTFPGIKYIHNKKKWGEEVGQHMDEICDDMYSPKRAGCVLIALCGPPDAHMMAVIPRSLLGTCQMEKAEGVTGDLLMLNPLPAGSNGPSFSYCQSEIIDRTRDARSDLI